MIGLSQPPLLRPPGDGNRCGNETTLADQPGAGPPSRPEQGSTPAHRFYRFGKHYRAGLQAPERVSIVRIHGSEVFGQSVEQSLGGPAAKCVSGDEGCSVAAIRKRRPRLARQPVDFERGCGWPRNLLSRRPTARSRASPPTRPRDRALPLAHAPLAHYDGLVRGLRVTKQLGQGLPTLSGAALVLQLAAPAVANSVSEGGAATCAAARLTIHETQIFTKISWKTMVKMSMPLTMATA